MGGCAAPFCNNSTCKGYIMKIFPRDPVRRVLWAQNVPRDNWTPTNNSYLCEVHFAPDMWEPGGKHKLKKDAIPTIFGFFLKKQISAKDIEIDGSIKSNADEIINITDSSKPTTDDIEKEEENIKTVIISDTSKQNDDVEHEAKNVETAITYDVNEFTSSVNMLLGIETKGSDKQENEKYKELMKKQQLYIFTMRRKIKAMRSTIRMLKNRINNDNYKKAISTIFNEDQIRALFKKDRTRNWSNETIQRAVKLKLTCGTNGYEEILRQGIPLPSLRTLRRKLESYKFIRNIRENVPKI